MSDKASFCCGHNTLTKTIARLCASAGIEGFKTDHSQCTTTATRLYQSGVDEQLVMERTGHRSLEGVRNYKRTSPRGLVVYQQSWVGLVAGIQIIRGSRTHIDIFLE